MRKLLSYYIKKRSNVIIITSLILLTIVFVYLIDARFVWQRDVWNEYTQSYDTVKMAQNSPFPMLAIFAIILSTIVPIFEFYYKMRKINVDQFHALPIKREKIYLTKYIIGLAEILIPLTLCFILSFILIVIKPHIFEMSYFFLYYISLVAGVIVLFTSVSFIYTRCNTFFDGIINILLYSIILVPVASIIINLFDVKYNTFGDSTWYFLQSPITRIEVLFEELFEGDKPSVFTSDYLTFIIFGVFGIVSFVLFILLNKKEKSENSMQISNSIFAYKLTLPVYIISLLAISLDGSSPILMVLVIIFGYLGHVIYKRSFKLTKYDYISLFVYASTGILLGLLTEYINTL